MKIVKQEKVIPFRLRPTLSPAREEGHHSPGPAFFLVAAAISFALPAIIIALYRIH